MSFDTVERSAAGRKPVELFAFFRDYQAWRYTSADRAITSGGAEFLPRPISRSAIETSSEMARGALKITAPRDLEVADLYRISPPTIPVTFTLQQLHYGDGEAVLLWSGRITTVDFQGAAAIITLEPVFTSLRRIGLRRIYQRQCPHVLYGTACRANRDSFRVDSTVDAISGTTVSVPAAAGYAAGHFAGGFIEYPVELGIAERRFITDHAGAGLTLSSTPVGLVVGAAVKVFPGCDHTLATCASKFGNALNFGGFPYFPQKNPFAGDPTY